MQRSPLRGPDPSLTVIDPSLIYTPIHTYASNASSDAGTSSPAPDVAPVVAPDVARSEHRSPTPNPDRPSPVSSRSQSQPRELTESWKFPRPQDFSRDPYPRHAQRPPHVPRPSSSLRQRPYTPRARRPGPTSTPASAVLTDRDGSPAIQNEAEKYIFTTYQDQTTLVMGVLVHLDALARQCEDMRTFIKTGFGSGNGDPNDGRSRVERTRLELRNWNRRHVTELDEILQPLPRLDYGELPRDAPSTGRMVQRLDHAAMTRLLDAYDLPFIPTMFLHEKKAIYLRFVGASRALMHRVLDERWLPTCHAALPARYQDNDEQSPNYIVAPALDMWATLQGIPRITSLTAFCTDRERGLQCRCYQSSVTGEPTLICLRHLYDDLLAKQTCLGECRC